MRKLVLFFHGKLAVEFRGRKKKYNTRYIPFFVAAAFKGCALLYVSETKNKKKVVGLTLELFLVHLPLKKRFSVSQI